MTTTAAFIDALDAAARISDTAEAECRAEFARRIAVIADGRAFAYRRLNLVRAVAETVARAEDREMAVVYGLALLRTRLGWGEDEGIRAEIADNFAPVCRALHLAGREGEEAEDSPSEALAAFETWYLGRVGTPFWLLFENAMPETPRVDF